MAGAVSASLSQVAVESDVAVEAAVEGAVEVAVDLAVEVAEVEMVLADVQELLVQDESEVAMRVVSAESQLDASKLGLAAPMTAVPEAALVVQGVVAPQQALAVARVAAASPRAVPHAS